MPLQCGIVGLPNVGKSTLFNALTQTMQAEAENYPFCTIDANIGRVAVPDERIEKLAELVHSKEIIKTQIEFVDIAGLVKGASKGEGLGNQFLANIRDVDCIAQVVRCFEDKNITHVEENIDPVRDIELVDTELILADLESLEKKIKSSEKKAKIDKHTAFELELMNKVYNVLSMGEPAIKTNILPDEEKMFKMLNLLSGKKQFFICNVDENSILSGNEYTKKVEQYIKNRNCFSTIISAKVESEIANLDDENEKQEFLYTLGLQHRGLDKIIKIAYNLLDLITFFTVGEKESRCWTIKKGYTAQQAAGVIHTDFEKGFIKAETISYEDYIKYGSEDAVKNAGKLRLEGKDYIVQDGDIFHFKFNV